MNNTTLRVSISTLGGVAVQPAFIEPLAADLTRPFWSVMIPIYNGREDYLRETLASVLRQDPGPEEMQIEVIDNCSTKFDPEPLVREVGGGRVTFHRQPENVGIVGNFNTCITRGRGHLIHILHADDTVIEGFYRRARAGIESNPDAAAAMCRTIFTDERGQWTGFAEPEAPSRCLLDTAFAMRQFIDQRIFFVTFVVRRSTYEELGGFRQVLPHCLDWDMWKRIALSKPIYYDPQPSGCYRMHDAADSSQLMETGRNVVEERQSIEISCALLPSEHAVRLRSAAREAVGIRATRRAAVLWRHGRRAAAWHQFVEGLRSSLAISVLFRSINFMFCIVFPLWQSAASEGRQEPASKWKL